MYYWKIIIIVGACISSVYLLPCVPRDYGNGGTVCVCNSTYCDTFGPLCKPSDKRNAVLYTSDINGLRFQRTTATFQNISSGDLQDADIRVTQSKTYQIIQGFGGAFTDSTGVNIGSLSGAAQDKLLRSYFAKEGLEYNTCRIPVGGTDFSLEAYSYDDGAPDPALKRFALHQADYKYKLPYIYQAKKLAGEILQFFASAWTAPIWMKTNGELHGGTIKRSMYGTWANYYVKFFDAYKKLNVTFWGLTTGNEPSLAKFPLVMINNLSSVGWTSEELADWVAGHLGPILRRNDYGDIKIMALDDQRFYVPWFMDAVFRNPIAKRYIAGTAVHWYWDTVFPAWLLTQLHDHYPNKFIMSTEACKGFFLTRGVVLGSWSRGEDYAQDIIEDMRNWVIGWVDWNMVLNTEGGPTYLQNVVDSPVIVNATGDEFYKQPMYYALGHFSKFVPRNSFRIASTETPKVSSVAFKRPDKGITLVILNRSKTNETLKIADESKGVLSLNVRPHSLTSLVYW